MKLKRVPVADVEAWDPAFATDRRLRDDRSYDEATDSVELPRSVADKVALDKASRDLAREFRTELEPAAAKVAAGLDSMIAGTSRLKRGFVEAGRKLRS